MLSLILLPQYLSSSMTVQLHSQFILEEGAEGRDRFFSLPLQDQIQNSLKSMGIFPVLSLSFSTYPDCSRTNALLCRHINLPSPLLSRNSQCERDITHILESIYCLLTHWEHQEVCAFRRLPRTEHPKERRNVNWDLQYVRSCFQDPLLFLLFFLFLSSFP